MKNRSWAFVPVVLGAALAVAGCGVGLRPASFAVSASAGPAPAVLGKAAANELKHASSVRISGAIQQGKEKITLNLGLTSWGDVSGSMSYQGASFSVLVTGLRHKHSYIQVTAGFLKFAGLPASACSKVCGKYLELSASDAKSTFGALTMPSLTASMFGGNPKLSYARSGTATVNGQAAWVLRDSNGGLVYVKSPGKHYVLRMSGGRGIRGGLNFTQWNGVTIPPAPPASQVINVGQVKG